MRGRAESRRASIGRTRLALRFPMIVGNCMRGRETEIYIGMEASPLVFLLLVSKEYAKEIFVLRSNTRPLLWPYLLGISSTFFTRSICDLRYFLLSLQRSSFI